MSCNGRLGSLLQCVYNGELGLVELSSQANKFTNSYTITWSQLLGGQSLVAKNTSVSTVGQVFTNELLLFLAPLNY